MRKVPTSRAPDCTVQKYIGSAYDNVKIVADNIDEVKQAAGVSLEIGQIIPHLSDIDTCADNIDAIKDAPNQATLAKNSADIAVAAETTTVQAKDLAVQKAVEADASKIAAGISEVNSKASETNTKASETVATAKAGEATTSAELAEKYANNPEDAEVVPGKYSAFHWAEKALYNANLTFISGGLFTPDAQKEYPDVTGISRDTIWIVRLNSRGAQYTFTTGDLAGKTVISGDQLFYDTPSNSWYTVSSGTAGTIISVNGQLGPSVTLTASDVGARPDTWTPTADEVGAVAKDSNTGKAQLPVGTTAQGGTPDKGAIRYDDELGKYVGGNGTAWNPLGGGEGTGVPNFKVSLQDTQGMVGEGHLLDCSLKSLTYTFPTGVAGKGDTVTVGDYKNSASMLNPLILTSDQKINGEDDVEIIITSPVRAVWQYIDDATGWYCVDGIYGI